MSSRWYRAQAQSSAGRDARARVSSATIPRVPRQVPLSDLRPPACTLIYLTPWSQQRKMCGCSSIYCRICRTPFFVQLATAIANSNITFTICMYACCLFRNRATPMTFASHVRDHLVSICGHETKGEAVIREEERAAPNSCRPQTQRCKLPAARRRTWRQHASHAFHPTTRGRLHRSLCPRNATTAETAMTIVTMTAA